MTHTGVEAAQARAVHRERLVVVLVLLPDREAHEHEVVHVPDEVERQAELLLPHRVEPVVLYDARSARDRARGGRRRRGSRRWGAVCRRRGGGRRGGVSREEGRVSPVRNVNRHLDERVDDGLVDDLAALRVLWAGELLRGDNLNTRNSVSQAVE